MHQELHTNIAQLSLIQAMLDDNPSTVLNPWCKDYQPLPDEQPFMCFARCPVWEAPKGRTFKANIKDSNNSNRDDSSLYHSSTKAQAATTAVTVSAGKALYPQKTA